MIRRPILNHWRRKAALAVGGKRCAGSDGPPRLGERNGDGPLRQELESQVAQRSRRAGTIRFLGAVAPADIPALMAQSELFVLPSVYKPHGIVVAEATAVGTPVIASRDCGAARGLVRNGKAGWLFKSGVAAELARVLSPAGTDPLSLRALRFACESGFARWYSRFGPTGVVPGLVSGPRG